MGVENLVSVFDKYGWPGIIAIIILTGMFIFLKYFTKKTEQKTEKSIEDIGMKLADIMAEQNTQVINRINEQNDKLISNLNETNQKLIEHIFDKKDETHQKSIEYRKDISDEIRNIMRELRAEVKASRVAILEFHNSNANLSGLAFLSYDMKYERQDIGVDTVSDNIKNRDISQLSWIMKQVGINDKHVCILNDEEDFKKLWEEASVLYSDLVDKIGVKCVVYVGIFDYNRASLLGLLAIEYHKPIEIEKIREEYYDYYLTYASRLSQLLTMPNLQDQ